jgi:hypothetical protein
MDSILNYGKFLLIADTALLAGFGLFILLLPRRSAEGDRISSPMLPVLGVMVFAEIAICFIYLGILLIARA